jgi:hypothetical protein
VARGDITRPLMAAEGAEATGAAGLDALLGIV